MKIFETKLELLSYLSSNREGNTIGFTPTMGSLHNGHLHLIEESKRTCDITICSIFVNPTQFNNDDDLVNYPRTLDVDLQKLRKLNCDVVYTPIISDLYEKREKAKKFDFGALANTMEGEFRPGHFNGMATIVEKFFRIIEPTKAFFGQKDLQQLQIVKVLVKQTWSEIEIVGINTVRDESGLAKSSRNKLLSEKSKKEATLIYESLQYCIEHQSRGVDSLKKYIETQFENHSNFELEYVEFVALESMLPITNWKGKGKNAICIAAYIDDVRLIDNIIL
mgnify:CR=1 FL=1